MMRAAGNPMKRMPDPIAAKVQGYKKTLASFPGSLLNVPSPQTPVFYIGDWLPPDFGAVGQYGLLFAPSVKQERSFLLD